MCLFGTGNTVFNSYLVDLRKLNALRGKCIARTNSIVLSALSRWFAQSYCVPRRTCRSHSYSSSSSFQFYFGVSMPLAVPREFARSTINRLCVCVSVSVDGAQRDCISTINFPSINSTKCYYDWFIHTHQSTWTGCVRVFFIWLDREIAQQLHGTDQQSSYTVNIIINLISFFVANQF